jgi:NAD(P)H dehydrogenase (quinone)
MLESIQKLRAAIFVSHPNHESLVTACCREIALSLRETGVAVDVFDLYEDRFDPILTLEEIRRRASFDPLVLQYQQAIRDSSLLVFGHPDWWGGAPAILKGFIDRVFQAGVAFVYDGPEFGRQSLRPLLTDKSALVVATTDRPTPGDTEPVARFWQEGVFAYCGIETATVKLFYGTRDSRLRGRKAWIAEAVVEAERLLEGERE